MKTVKRIWMVILDLVFPKRCPVCDRPLKIGTMICRECEDKLVRVGGTRCLKCGKQISDSKMEYCYDCSHIRHRYTAGISLYEYNSVSKSIYGLKYKGRCEYAQYFGSQLAIHFHKKIKDWNIDGIVPVPLHKSKMRIRGYNQAYLLARPLSEFTNIPIYNDLIIRDKKTTPLKELDPKMRQINLKNAFIIKHFDVKLDSILIVDDIYTTGSTMDAMAKVLIENGVKNVYFITLAVGNGF